MSDFRILHLWADDGIEDEVLHTFGDVVRVGIDAAKNPYSSAIRADARDPPLSGSFDLALAHPPCQRFSVATPGSGVDPDSHPDQIDDARSVCREFADHYIIENVPDAPLRDPVFLSGGMFGLPIQYERAFETSFRVPTPSGDGRWCPSDGPLAEQGRTGKAWVGTNNGWRLAKGYCHEWDARGLKRHAVPAAYLRRLLYWWLTALDAGTGSTQAALDEVTP